MALDRRAFLASLAASASLSLWPGTLFAKQPGGRRNVVVMLLRGGLDGLHALPAHGDPDYRRLRAAFELELPSSTHLDGLFAMHPALGFCRELYRRGHFLPVLGVAPPYQGRSHFDAQDCLENGGPAPGALRDGWMNRCIGALPDAGALAIASVTPLIFRGTQPVASWWPALPRDVSPALMMRLETLYAADPVLAPAFAQAMLTSAPGDPAMPGRDRSQGRLPGLAAKAASLMAEAGGPRLGFIEDGGWDSHGNQASLLDRKLAELDAAIKALHDGLGENWQETVVMVVTEFGRTAAINGTRGTDHGTASHAFLAGGAVHGGRIAGHWPGLGARDLNEGRDLRAGIDTRSLFKGVLAAQLGIPESRLASVVFPGSENLAPLEGLVAAPVG